MTSFFNENTQHYLNQNSFERQMANRFLYEQQERKRKRKKLIRAVLILAGIVLLVLGFVFFPKEAPKVLAFVFATAVLTAFAAWHASILIRMSENEEVSGLEKIGALLTGAVFSLGLISILNWLYLLIFRKDSNLNIIIGALFNTLLMLSLGLLFLLGEDDLWLGIICWVYYILIVEGMLLWGILRKK